MDNNKKFRRNKKMKKQEDIIESLLREHARSKGVDEEFLEELEKRLDEEQDVKVIVMNDSSDSSAGGKSGSRVVALGIGIAACAAVYFVGTSTWRDASSDEIALDSGAGKAQIKRETNSLYSEGALLSEVEYDALNGKNEVQSGGKLVDVNEPDVLQVKKNNNLDKFIAKSVPKISQRSNNSTSDNKKIKFSNPLARNRRNSANTDINRGAIISKNAGGGGAVFGLGVKKKLPGIMRGKRERCNIVDIEATLDKYGKLVENEFVAPVDKESKRSTFAVDVDTASYTNLRKMIQSGRSVPADSVRIEEMVNYFDYGYEKPLADSEHPFAVHVDGVVCPWNKENKLVRVAIQGKDVVREHRPASNVVFLLDVSGSMNHPDKLPLLKDSLKYLLEELNDKDTVSMVVYAGASGLALPATKVDDAGRAKIMAAMDKLSAGGSTAGGAGIKLAYKVAQENFIKGGVNRVILATDGDFNVGVSDTKVLADMVKSRAKKGVDVSVLGFGQGNLNDAMLELITNNGNGNYSYIDTIKEGRKVLLEDMMGTMVTIAKDVKVQVEFNPEKVKEYRLVGYSNRMLPNSAFLDKKADAGEIGASHRVTAFYEIVPGKAVDKSELDGLRYGKKKKPEVEEVALPAGLSDELMHVKLAYKKPDQKVHDESTYLSVPYKDEIKKWEEVGEDFKFASSVALFGMVLRDSDKKGAGDLDLVQRLAESGVGADGKGYRGEFINLVKKVKGIKNPNVKE